MTTPSRPRRGRALRFYGPSMSDAFLPTHVTQALNLARGRNQAPYYVAAYTKADAVRHLEAAGIRVTPRLLRMQGSGYISLAALLDAGLLANEGDIVAWVDRGGVESVRGIVTVHPGGEVRVWGNWQLSRFDCGSGPVRYVTFALRHADLARFPERRGDEPPTPATGWTLPANWTETRP